MSTILDETTVRTGPTDPVGTDQMRTLKTLKLGGLSHTQPQRLALARQHKLGSTAPAPATDLQRPSTTASSTSALGFRNLANYTHQKPARDRRVQPGSTDSLGVMAGS